MSKIAVVYWSGTGNTEAMANFVAEGVRNKGGDVSVFSVEKFTADMISDYDAIAFGCPAMGAEELEDTVFLPAFESYKPDLSGKKIALFGSYGWGDGEWMRTWEDMCRDAGAFLVTESVICNEAPDDTAAGQCRDLGAAL